LFCRASEVTARNDLVNELPSDKHKKQTIEACDSVAHQIDLVEHLVVISCQHRHSIHDLRHQYASFLVNSGQSLYTVQQILGHSDPSVTQRYAHLSTKALQDAANSASVAIKGAMQVSV